MIDIQQKGWPAVVGAFLAAVVLATVWGSIVQTQFNLGAIAAMGVSIPPALWIRSTVADIFSGFSPTYGGYVVLPSLLVAFAVAWWASRSLPRSVLFWFALGGGVGLFLGIPVVNFLSPVALLVGASRDWLCTLLMSLGGVVAGMLFVRLCFGPGTVRRRAVMMNEKMHDMIATR